MAAINTVDDIQAAELAFKMGKFPVCMWKEFKIDRNDWLLYQHQFLGLSSCVYRNEYKPDHM
jgi:hypothetical protein